MKDEQRKCERSEKESLPIVPRFWVCPFGYGECESANGCCYPGRCNADKTEYVIEPVFQYEVHAI